MQLKFLPEAEKDLEAIADYIALNNPARALSFVQELKEQCYQLLDNPKAYPLKPELGKNLRLCVYGKYLIFYTLKANELLLVRILQGARNLPAIFNATH